MSGSSKLRLGSSGPSLETGPARSRTKMTRAGGGWWAGAAVSATKSPRAAPCRRQIPHLRRRLSLASKEPYSTRVSSQVAHCCRWGLAPRASRPSARRSDSSHMLRARAHLQRADPRRDPLRCAAGARAAGPLVTLPTTLASHKLTGLRAAAPHQRSGPPVAPRQRGARGRTRRAGSYAGTRSRGALLAAASGRPDCLLAAAREQQECLLLRGRSCPWYQGPGCYRNATQFYCIWSHDARCRVTACTRVRPLQRACCVWQQAHAARALVWVGLVCPVLPLACTHWWRLPPWPRLNTNQPTTARPGQGAGHHSDCGRAASSRAARVASASVVQHTSVPPRCISISTTCAARVLGGGFGMGLGACLEGPPLAPRLHIAPASPLPAPATRALLQTAVPPHGGPLSYYASIFSGTTHASVSPPLLSRNTYLV